VVEAEDGGYLLQAKTSEAVDMVMRYRSGHTEAASVGRRATEQAECAKLGQ